MAEDMVAKYVMPYLNHGEQRYLEMAQGTKTLQRAGFYRYRRPYLASKYESAYATSDSLSLRANAVSDLSVTLYSDGYVHVKFGNAGAEKLRSKAGEAVTVPCKADTANDLETYIYSAGSISRLGDLSGLMADRIELNSAVKLRNLPLGSQTLGYENRDLEQLSFGTIHNLESIDLTGLTNLEGTLDLSGFDALREIYASGSGISGVIFAPNAPVETAILPKVGTLILLGQRKLNRLSMDPSGLINLRLEDCPNIDSLTLVRNATALQRGRITNIHWEDADTDLLLRLAGLTGYDEEGRATDTFVLTGTAHVSGVCQEELDLVHRVFPNLELFYDEIVPSYTVTFLGAEEEVLYTQVVRQGGMCPDPVATGKISTPTKASTVEYQFYFAGWDGSLAGVQSHLTLHALFSATTRRYTVRWFDGSRLLQTDVVQVFEPVSYQGDDLIPPTEEEIWIGWDKTRTELERVTGDMDVYAVYISPLEEIQRKEGYTYLYSDDPADDMAYSLREFYSILYRGLAKEYFLVGDKIKISPRTTVYADTSIVLIIYGFHHFKLAEGETFASTVFGMVGLMNASRSMNSTSTNKGGWPATAMRKYLNNSVFPSLPIHWKSMIKTVRVLSTAGGTSGEILVSEDKLFLFSNAELGFSATAAPYSQEVEEGAETVTFSCFTTSTSRIRKSYNGTGTASHWFLRSPIPSDSQSYNCVSSTGALVAATNGAERPHGVSFGFCI